MAASLRSKFLGAGHHRPYVTVILLGMSRALSPHKTNSVLGLVSLHSSSTTPLTAHFSHISPLSPHTLYSSMTSSVRVASMNLTRVPMARVPLVAAAGRHVALISHANSAHSSAYSSMPLGARKGSKDSAPNWAQSASEVADKLEDSAEKLAKDYLREVKQFDNTEDNMMKEFGLAMNSSISSSSNSHAATEDNHHHYHNQSGGKSNTGSHHRTSTAYSPMTTFEQTLVGRVQAEVIHPEAKQVHNTHRHQEMVSSLVGELKVLPCISRSMTCCQPRMCGNFLSPSLAYIHVLCRARCARFAN